MKRVPLRQGLFKVAEDLCSGSLLASRCSSCRRHAFPAQELCPYCAGDSCQMVELASWGLIEVCTTVLNRPPGYDGPIPFGFGVVELPEGIRILARIRDPQGSIPGTKARLIFEPLGTDHAGNEVITYAFEPQP